MVQQENVIGLSATWREQDALTRVVAALAHAGATRSLTDSEQQLFSAACKTATKVFSRRCIRQTSDIPLVLNFKTEWMLAAHGKYPLQP